jgi:membrane fusion protein (multidrug efflux system)
VDVFVSLPSAANFLLGESVVGNISVARARGLLVPRAAILPAGRAYTLFTIQNGHAVRHLVAVGLRNTKEVEVKGANLRAGEPVVVLGNYELKDGMAVRVEGTP